MIRFGRNLCSLSPKFHAYSLVLHLAGLANNKDWKKAWGTTPALRVPWRKNDLTIASYFIFSFLTNRNSSVVIFTGCLLLDACTARNGTSQIARPSFKDHSKISKGNFDSILARPHSALAARTHQLLRVRDSQPMKELTRRRVIRKHWCPHSQSISLCRPQLLAQQSTFLDTLGYRRPPQLGRPRHSQPFTPNPHRQQPPFQLRGLPRRSLLYQARSHRGGLDYSH